MKVLLVLVVVSAPGAWAFAKDPDCTGVEQWPASMAFVHLKNAGLIDKERIDFTKTSVVRLASEKVGKDLDVDRARRRMSEAPLRPRMRAQDGRLGVPHQAGPA